MNLKKPNYDVRVLSDEYEHLWEIFLDKGYQGVQEFFRGIHPIKKPGGSSLSQSEIRLNAKVSADRIIVEN